MDFKIEEPLASVPDLITVGRNRDKKGGKREGGWVEGMYGNVEWV